MNIYEKIFTRLEELHMSQIELSRRTGIATSTISDWRKKKINPQADKLMEEVFLCQRVKTGQKDVLAVIRDIRKAIKEKKKIQFKYLHREIDDVTKEVVRNRGKRFTVSPYKLMISDGNYYLLAYSDQARDMRLFRMDKIQKVEILHRL